MPKVKCKHIFMSNAATDPEEMECRVCGETERLENLEQDKDGLYQRRNSND